jgi:hypothetical protein
MIVQELIDKLKPYSDFNLVFYFNNKETNLRRVLNISHRPVDFDSISVIDIEDVTGNKIKELIVRLK